MTTSLFTTYWHWMTQTLAALPNDTRIDKPTLEAALKTRWVSFQNPNTHRFFNAITNTATLQGTLRPAQDGAVSIQLPSDIDITSDLQLLSPWRKGPFMIGQQRIDSEWNSHLKWQRFEPYFNQLKTARIVDIGCGNGYYMCRALDHAPKHVLGMDPSDLGMMQFYMIQTLIQHPTLHYLPLGWQDASSLINWADVVFLMGVMAHQRSPLDLLNRAKMVGHRGMSLWFDTLIIDDPSDMILFPKDRYAKMRNVYFIPSIPALKSLLKKSGFHRVDILSVDTTSPNEQRATPWASNQSLSDFLDPSDPSKTVEGYPAPKRVALVASAQ